MAGSGSGAGRGRRRWGRSLGALAGAVLLGAAPPAAALIGVGSIETPEQVREVEIVGTALYAVDGGFGPDAHLRIFDISNPAAPVALGSLAAPGTRRTLAVHNGLVFVTRGRSSFPSFSGRLLIVDVSDPTLPERLSAVTFAGDVGSVAPLGDLAYVTSSDPRGLVVVDVSDPSAPAIVNVFPTASSALGVAVAGGRAYVTLQGRVDNFLVLDLADPTAPVELGRTSLVDAFGISGPGSRIVVEDGVAYVVGEQGGGSGQLFLVDVSDPARPALLAAPEVGSGSGIEVRGDVAFLAGSGVLTTLDVSDARAPALLGIYSPPLVGNAFDEFGDIALAGSRAYLAGGNTLGSTPAFGRIAVVDVNRVDRPALVGAAHVGDSFQRTWDVAVEDGLAIVAPEPRPFAAAPPVHLLDVSEPGALVERSQLQTRSPVRAIALEAGLAYLDTGPLAGVLGPTEFVVVNVSDAANPVEIGSLELSPSGGSLRDIEVAGGRAYVGDSQAFRIIDVSDPRTPTLLLDELRSASALEVVGHTAYVVGFGGLSILDVSDPAAPVELGRLDAFGGFDVEVGGGLAYFAEFQGVRIVDVTDPANPVEIASFPRTGQDLELGGERVFMSGLSFSEVIDVSDPANPTSLGLLIFGGRNAQLADGLLYLAGGVGRLFANFFIVDFGPEFRSSLEVEIQIHPGKGRALVDPKGHGVLPVVLLGSAEFDVSRVDRTTLAFGPLGATPAHKQGGHPANPNGDGFKDLLSHYRIDETGIGVGDTRACVTGETLDGTPFRGCAPLLTIPPCGLGAELVLLLPVLFALRRRRVW